MAFNRHLPFLASSTWRRACFFNDKGCPIPLNEIFAGKARMRRFCKTTYTWNFARSVTSTFTAPPHRFLFCVRASVVCDKSRLCSPAKIAADVEACKVSYTVFGSANVYSILWWSIVVRFALDFITLFGSLLQIRQSNGTIPLPLWNSNLSEQKHRTFHCLSGNLRNYLTN